MLLVVVWSYGRLINTIEKVFGRIQKISFNIGSTKTPMQEGPEVFGALYRDLKIELFFSGEKYF